MEERTKRLEVAKVFQRERAKNLVRIKGAFGFRRFLTRGQANVLGETILLALAHNVFKLHQKIQGGHVGAASGTIERRGIRRRRK